MIPFVFHSKSYRIIPAILACALLYASVHFVLHEIDESFVDLTLQDDCKICRLTHVPVVPGSAVFLPNLTPDIAYFLPPHSVRGQDALRFPTLGARAIAATARKWFF